MNTKSIIWLGFFVGSTAGGFLPLLWGGGLFAMTIFSAVGGIAGIWAGYKVSR